jgi:hypothetical protein
LGDFRFASLLEVWSIDFCDGSIFLAHRDLPGRPDGYTVYGGGPFFGFDYQNGYYGGTGTRRLFLVAFPIWPLIILTGIPPTKAIVRLFRLRKNVTHRRLGFEPIMKPRNDQH